MGRHRAASRRARLGHRRGRASQAPSWPQRFSFWASTGHVDAHTSTSMLSAPLEASDAYSGVEAGIICILTAPVVDAMGVTSAGTPRFPKKGDVGSMAMW